MICLYKAANMVEENGNSFPNNAS